ncbi:MAG: hypothetical protein MR368_04325 [Azospirillum sp.]|nr:hypothetical protein [Azospirillum sp.]
MPTKTSNKCSVRGVINKFNELKYMTDIPHTISTEINLLIKPSLDMAQKSLTVQLNPLKEKLLLKSVKKPIPI